VRTENFWDLTSGENSNVFIGRVRMLLFVVNLGAVLLYLVLGTGTGT